MKIALVHTGLRRAGGMESYLIDLVRGFQEAGDQVHVYAREVDAQLAADLGVTAHRVGMPPLWRDWRNRAYADRIARLRLRDRYPLVIALSRTRGHHLAINGGTHPGFVVATGRHTAAHDRCETALERAALDDARVVVAHSRRLAAEIATHYPQLETPVRVLYPPIDGRRFRVRSDAERRQLRSRFGLAERNPVFLFPAMDRSRKGLAPLLQAFATAAPRAQLLLAGRRPGLPLPPNVRALGYVLDMPALYAAVDWTVLPSRYEPFGLAIAESLACGTPAIVSAGAGVTELMAVADGVQLPALDMPAIAAALHQAGAARPRLADGFIERSGLRLADHIAALREAAAVC